MKWRGRRQSANVVDLRVADMTVGWYFPNMGSTGSEFIIYRDGTFDIGAMGSTTITVLVEAVPPTLIQQAIPGFFPTFRLTDAQVQVIGDILALLPEVKTIEAVDSVLYEVFNAKLRNKK